MVEPLRYPPLLVSQVGLPIILYASLVSPILFLISIS